MGSPPTINRVGGLIRNIEKPFKLWSCSLVHFYNSKVSQEGREKKTGGSSRKSFDSVLPFGLARTKKLKLIYDGTGSFQLGIGQFPPFWPIHLWYYKGAKLQKIARAKNERRRGGWGAAPNALSAGRQGIARS